MDFSLIAKYLNYINTVQKKEKAVFATAAADKCKRNVKQAKTAAQKPFDRRHTESRFKTLIRPQKQTLKEEQIHEPSWKRSESLAVARIKTTLVGFFCFLSFKHSANTVEAGSS